RELNIGVDSLAFFDDNPAERLLMQAALPQVLTLDVPVDALHYRGVLHDSLAFERLSFTVEDRRRAEMYTEQAERAKLQSGATSLEEFLCSLQMQIEITDADDLSFARVLELLHKTNQFNLTTRRHSASRVAEMIADPAFGVFCCRVRDRFGDNGITGVMIASLHEETIQLDTLLLSCRVIGRTIETALLAFLAGWGRAGGAHFVEGEFLPTKKNAPAAQFFAQHEFDLVDQTEAGSLWRLNLNETQPRSPAYIEVIDETKRETASVSYANIG
ncbi:MAG: hypothetical protein MSG64_19420, partial [Pyrinomonadaceae bacterium MAG19_C2-C3]|nr:hypothetical protein [Pyrinomonadaceae bacterium MAG19_C2-C3]